MSDTKIGWRRVWSQTKGTLFLFVVKQHTNKKIKLLYGSTHEYRKSFKTDSCCTSNSPWWVCRLLLFFYFFKHKISVSSILRKGTLLTGTQQELLLWPILNSQCTLMRNRTLSLSAIAVWHPVLISLHVPSICKPRSLLRTRICKKKENISWLSS